MEAWKVLALAIAGLALAPPAAFGQQAVGTAAAVNPASTANQRTLTIGANILHNERVRTSGSGSVQLLFIDRTSMNIGPNSDINIDEYVFDPNTNTGRMAVTVGKGLMRFVGGSITHSGEATVTTPSATIGIRGGTSTIQVEGGKTTSVNHFGNQSIQAGGGVQEISRSDFMSIVQGIGGFASTPIPVPPSLLASFNLHLASAPGQTGGSRGVTQGAVNQANNNATGGSDVAANVTTDSQPLQGGNNVTNTLANAAKDQQLLQQIQLTTQQGGQNNVALQNVQSAQRDAVAFAMSNTRCCDPNNQTSVAPYLPPQFAFGGNYLISPVLGYRAAAGNAVGGATLQYGVNITGTGAAQSSWFFVATGSFLDDGNGGEVFGGGFVGTRRSASNISMGRASGPISSPAGAVNVGANGIPTSATINGTLYDPDAKAYASPSVAQPGFFPGGPSGGGQNYSFTQQLSQIPTPAGLGSNRPATELFAFTSGIMQTFNVTAGGSVGSPFAVAGGGIIFLDPSTSRLQANFGISNLTSSSPPGIFQFGIYQLGSLDPSQRARSAYIDYDNFGARDAGSTDVNGNRTIVSTVNGGPLTFEASAMVNVSAANAQALGVALGNNVTFCQCEFTRWGFWSTDNQRAGTSGQTFADRGHMMLWVAGKFPGSSNDIPIGGIATYNGHIIANINNNGQQYIDAGNFQNVVNFATNSGTVTTNLDNATYTGTVNFLGDRRFFGGGLAGTLGRNMTLGGSFFQNSQSPFSEMGGYVQVTGTNYNGAGIFAAKR
jgi:hypothetical protein